MKKVKGFEQKYNSNFQYFILKKIRYFFMIAKIILYFSFYKEYLNILYLVKIIGKLIIFILF